jgi:hypothetical protein
VTMQQNFNRLLRERKIVSVKCTFVDDDTVLKFRIKLDNGIQLTFEMRVDEKGDYGITVFVPQPIDSSAP